MMADCERALGRPDRALALARNPAVANLAPDLKAEMTIVEAGARRDLGEIDAALRTLENAPLRSKTRADWVVRLRYAYADTLHAAGRTAEAIEWFHRTVAIDSDQITDAARAASTSSEADASRSRATAGLRTPAAGPRVVRPHGAPRAVPVRPALLAGRLGRGGACP